MNISLSANKIASSLSSTQNSTSAASKLASNLSSSNASKRLATLSSSESASLALSNKVMDLSSIKSTMQQQSSTLDHASNAAFETGNLIDKVRKETSDANYILEKYKEGTISKDDLGKVLTDYQSFYQTALDQIDQTSKDSSILTGGKITLMTASSLVPGATIQGADLSSEGLKLKTKAAKDSTIANEDKPLIDQDISQMISAITDPTDTDSIDKISKVLEARYSAVSSAEGTAFGLSKSLSAGVDTLKQASDSVTTMINNLSAGATQAREADMKDASVSALSQRTSVMLGRSGASFAGQSEMAIIQSLFK